LSVGGAQEYRVIKEEMEWLIKGRWALEKTVFVEFHGAHVVKEGMGMT
jgi:hypothetical protein